MTGMRHLGVAAVLLCVLSAVAGPLSAQEALNPAFTTPARLLNRTQFFEAVRRQYPADLRSRGIGGEVVLRVLITREGRLSHPQILHGSGNVALDSAALRVVKVMRWKPALLYEKPVDMMAQFPVVFRPASARHPKSQPLRPKDD